MKFFLAGTAGFAAGVVVGNLMFANRLKNIYLADGNLGRVEAAVRYALEMTNKYVQGYDAYSHFDNVRTVEDFLQGRWMD